MTKMEAPVEELVRRMEVPVSVIVYDVYMSWVFEMGSKMNIQVASLFTMSATVFAMCYYYDLLVENCNAGDKFSGGFKSVARKTEQNYYFVFG